MSVSDVLCFVFAHANGLALGIPEFSGLRGDKGFRAQYLLRVEPPALTRLMLPFLHQSESNNSCPPYSQSDMQTSPLS